MLGRLHSGQNLQQLVVRQKEEPLETLALALQELIQGLLDYLKVLVICSQQREVQPTVVVVGPALCSVAIADHAHHFLPSRVSLCEYFLLLRQVLLRVGRV